MDDVTPNEPTEGTEPFAPESGETPVVSLKRKALTQEQKDAKNAKAKARRAAKHEPAQASAEESDTMTATATTTTKKAKRIVGATKRVKKVAKPKRVAKVTKPRAASAGPRGEKTKEVSRLLQRKNGCTRAEILAATGWPAISVQAIAKNCHLKLRKEKEKGSPTSYFGTPA